ncbi:unnamed protein product [Paramecium sonneborni]|uniref:Uncharacterized protein n=1 Tax=Paramecium sonneborni TaxID=65129 RepID=A0A8S1NMZ8_9CILI|nr:unnamed protein product [Paramecium sonneborni]
MIQINDCLDNEIILQNMQFLNLSNLFKNPHQLIYQNQNKDLQLTLKIMLHNDQKVCMPIYMCNDELNIYIYSNINEQFCVYKKTKMIIRNHHIVFPIKDPILKECKHQKYYYFVIQISLISFFYFKHSSKRQGNSDYLSIHQI